MKHRKNKAREIYDPAQGAAAAQAREKAREKRRAKAAAAYLGTITKHRLRYLASLLDFARAAAEAGPGYDGAPPVIVDAPAPGENPQLRVARNVREHPLDLMAHKRQISTEQFGAGDLFRRDLELAQISPLSGRAYESIYTIELSQAKAAKEAGLEEMLGPKTFAARRAKQPIRWDDLRPATLDAMDRVNKAFAYVAARAGRAAADIAVHVCRDRLTLADVGVMRKFGHRNRVGRLFQAALDALAEHYGTKPGRGRGGIRAWGDGSHVPLCDGASDARSASAPAELEPVG